MGGSVEKVFADMGGSVEKVIADMGWICGKGDC